MQNHIKICINNEITREEVVKQCVLTVGLLQKDAAQVLRWIHVAPVRGVRGPAPSEVNAGGLEYGP
ncbi:MAG: hypothetical protein ACU0B1_15565 [Thermohalobaculum sp.]